MAEPGRLDLQHPLFRARTGRGVWVAVIDSGVAAGHPHVGKVSDGLAIDHVGEPRREFDDRLGHGTAVAAVVREKAPEAELLAIKVFFARLATSATALARAIDLAVERGAHLINLSLGTDNPKHEATLQASLERAEAAGSIVVSPSRHRGRRWLPGSLTRAVGVELDQQLSRHQVRAERAAGRTRWWASGLPRPVPGVPPERNLQGISFAAANLSGLLARALEDPTLRSLDRLAEAAFSSAVLTRERE